MELKPVAVSPGQCRHACGLRDFVVARAVEIARERRLARRSHLGVTSSPSRVGRLDHGIKEHAIVFLLSVVDLVFLEVARDKRSHARSTSCVAKLRRFFALRDRRDLEQIFYRHVADRFGFVLVVDGRQMARSLQREADSFSNCLRDCKRLDNLGTKVS